MFEDFKEKVRQYNPDKEKAEPTLYSPDVLETLKQRGIDPNNFTLQQLFPPTFDMEGNDMSLMSGAEIEILITYLKTRKYLLEQYPQSKEQAALLGRFWHGEPDDPYQIDTKKARENPKHKVFYEALLKLAAIYDKVEALQRKASEYEKICIRFYWHLTYNWYHAPDIKGFRNVLEDSHIFETVEAYFKICKKYDLPVFEEPYYFLSEQRRLEIKLEGDMLKRSSDYSDFEIRISILEELD